MVAEVNFGILGIAVHEPLPVIVIVIRVGWTDKATQEPLPEMEPTVRCLTLGRAIVRYRIPICPS